MSTFMEDIEKSLYNTELYLNNYKNISSLKLNNKEVNISNNRDREVNLSNNRVERLNRSNVISNSNSITNSVNSTKSTTFNNISNSLQNINDYDINRLADRIIDNDTLSNRSYYDINDENNRHEDRHLDNIQVYNNSQNYNDKQDNLDYEENNYYNDQDNYDNYNQEDNENDESSDFHPKLWGDAAENIFYASDIAADITTTNDDSHVPYYQDYEDVENTDILHDNNDDNTYNTDEYYKDLALSSSSSSFNKNESFVDQFIKVHKNQTDEQNKNPNILTSSTKTASKTPYKRPQTAQPILSTMKTPAKQQPKSILKKSVSSIILKTPAPKTPRQQILEDNKTPEIKKLRAVTPSTAAKITERLFAAQKRADERVNLMRQQLQAKIESDCTFAPNIENSKRTRSSERSRSKSPATFNRDAIRKAKEDAAFRECTFKPRINDSSRKKVLMSDYVPIHDRVGQLQRDSHRNLMELQNMDEDDFKRNAPFTPRLNKKSLAIANKSRSAVKSILKSASTPNLNPRGDTNFISLSPSTFKDRPHLIPATELELLGEIRNIRKSRLFNETQQRDGCTFRPKLDDMSMKIVEDSAIFRAAPSFLERQETFLEMKKLRIENIANKFNDEAECTFRPKIMSRSDSTKSLNNDIPNSSLSEEIARENRICRLSMDGDRFRAQKEALQRHHYEQFTFKPKCNESQESYRKLQRKMSQGSLSAPTTPRNKAEVDSFVTDKNAFIPQLNRKSVEIVSRLRAAAASISPSQIGNRKQSFPMLDVLQSETLPDRIDSWKQKKESKIEDIRRSIEIDNLKECTFTPRFYNDSNIVHPKNHVPVAGLYRFFETRKHAQDLKEELRLREERVFSKNAKSRESKLTTPREFNFDSEVRASLRNESKCSKVDAAERKFSQEYTFKPETNESRNRELIRKLLEQD